MGTKIAKGAFFAMSLIMASALLFTLTGIDSKIHKFSPLVIFAFVAMLVVIGIYTYSRFFDEGIFRINKYAQWGAIVAAAAIIMLVYMEVLSGHASPVVFNRMAPIPAALSLFYVLVAIVTLGGDAFLGPIRYIVRLWRLPEKEKSRSGDGRGR